MNKPTILFINHSATHCGVYQYGKRIYDIIKHDPDSNYIYKEINNLQEYNTVLIDNLTITAIIYNYHLVTLSWLNEHTIQRKAINIGILHESHANFFDITCDNDPTITSTNNHYSLQRPIFEAIDYNLDNSKEEIKAFITAHKDDNVPIFGSFGFGFPPKGFDKLIHYVNDQYDNAVIKLVMTIAHFEPDKMMTYRLAEHCRNIPLKPGIKLMISHEFFSDNEILTFLESNTMNIFLYDTMTGKGISSVIDYALSVKKPIGISDSYMFRHIYTDEICLYKRTIADCMAASPAHLHRFLEEYSHANLIKTFRNIVSSK